MTILFVFAHPDDEAFGPFGTMAMLAKDNEVHALCLCDGRRPGSWHVSKSRVKAFINNCDQLNVHWDFHDNADLTLDYRNTVSAIEDAVKAIKPNTVYTHNISDLNKDHRLVADATLVACRPMPNSTVNELYSYETQASTDWAFAQVTPVFTPTVYQDITDYIDNKKQALTSYSTETHATPDARSVDAMTTLARYRGQQVGLEYAEAFQLVFSRRRKTL